MLAVFQNMVDDGVVTERQEDVDAHGARYTQRIPVEHHHCAARGFCSRAHRDVISSNHVLMRHIM